MLFKSKKKISNNRIRLNVVFLKINGTLETTTARIFEDKNLCLCVQHALCFAKRHSCQIKSMTQLTTK